ncbi:methyltransferase domain-containing protein [Methanosarcina sp. UBA411]|jgi:tellurite methyltransferase|uniref:methyltransferase domain-containing protein n=1 Tax=Methanosarcina sp. UBA411 TaxID=1915589 RepID=UPI0025E64114|nr:methyltransferase domain-containing protein [Methanosarcina sp. UBA411]
MDKKQLQEIYLKPDYYWGKKPNELVDKVLEFIPDGQITNKKLIDLGAGEGRDSVFFALQGFNVLAVEIAPAGLEKAVKLARENNTTIETMEADINDVALPKIFDVVYSIGTLQYIRPENRKRQFGKIKNNTKTGDINVMCTFVEHPDVEIAPDWGKNECLYESQELQSYYKDWELLYSNEYIFDCKSSNIPHQHAVRIIIARKPNNIG